MAEMANSARRLMGWVWRDYLRRRWPMLALAFVFMALEGSAVGGLSYLVRPMFDGIYAGGPISTVYWVAVSVAGVFIARAVAGFSHRVIMARQSERIAADMQQDLLVHVMKLDLGYFLINPPGSLIERLRGDSGALKGLWPPMLQALGRDTISLLSLLAVAVSIDWLWTLIAVVGVPIVFGPLMLLQQSVRQTARQSREAASVLSTRLDETFHGIRTLQLTGTEAKEAGRFRAALNSYLRVAIKSQTASAAIPALIDLVAALGFAGVMLYGGSQIVAGDKTMGEFMSFFTAMALVFEPLRRLGSISASWAAARASLDRMRNLLDVVPGLASPPHPRPLPDMSGGAWLELRDLGFAYSDLPVLRGVSFVAEAGKTTALVGPSGAGKTTVFHLLTRMADPQSGQVLLQGVDLRDLDLAEIRHQFSVVSQESALFDETLSANVRLGAVDQSEAGLIRALQDANAAEFVDKLPLGAETLAGPRGSALSGGQRQRIAIARALLRSAPILLLDEATSALDSQSEKLVTDALDRLSHGRTTLVIAHRLSTILQADKIVVMNKGQIVDQGTHEELLVRGGLYADLYRLQFKD
ncbi:MAG: ABC transporter ATP-binding protein [bacterium]